MTARDDLLEIAHGLQLELDFPADVMAETSAWLADPKIDDPSLVDRTAWPFVTIDNEHSKDLDQALLIEREGDGYLVAYAIADAAFYVRPGSALFRESMRRGASYYFPGFSVPMLPRSLSEGLISLNPDGARRALLFLHRLDAEGNVLDTKLERARVRSRAKLSFSGVQQLIDAPQTSALRGQDYEVSLQLLRVVGRLRMSLASRRGLIRYRREEVQIEIDGQGLGFTITEAVRDEVEAWNEQISLLCNAEGGRLLRESGNPAVQPIYRVQPGPEESRLDELARLTVKVAQLHEKPETPWVWNRAMTSLAEYLNALPYDGDHRLASAIARQAVMVNMRSEYSTEPGKHTGVGAEPYARFSAPMREMVGVFLHKEAQELLTGIHPSVEEDEALRAEVVTVANRARETQRKVSDLSGSLVMEKIFSRAGKRVFTGTVMGFTTNKVHVRLDDPPMDVKLYLFDLAPAFGGAWLEPAEDGAILRAKNTTVPLLKLGQQIDLRVKKFDAKTKRWILFPVLPLSPAEGQ